MKPVKTAYVTLFMVISVSIPLSATAQIFSFRNTPPQTAHEALQQTVNSLDLQTRLPEETTEPAVDNDRQEKNRRWSGPLLSKEMARFLLWAALITLIIVIIWNLRGNLWSSSRARKLTHTEKEKETTPVATAARMEKAQLEADELARRGDFAEAMHVLLLQSFNELRRRLDISIAVSLTSREILHAIGLPPPARRAFGDIIGRVEVSYFGNYRPSAEDYSACRTSFEALSDALRHGKRI